MGFKGTKQKVLTATLGSFLLFQQPISTVLAASEAIEKEDKTTKVVNQKTSSSSADESTKSTTTDSTTESTTTDGKITVTNSNKTAETVESLEEALQKVEENGTITIGKDLTLDKAITTDKKKITITSASGTKPVLKKKTAEMNMIQVTDGSTITVKGDLTFDGEILENGNPLDSKKAMIQVEKNGHFIIEENVTLKNARCGWQDFATINNLGTVDMKGGTITGAYAARNAGVFVDTGAIFNFEKGLITKCKVSHTNTAVGVKGTFNLRGGEITDNQTAWANGGVLVYKGGTMNFDSGKIHDNRSENKSGITVEDTGKLTLGKNADLAENLVLLGDTTKVEVKSTELSNYSTKTPLQVLVEKPAENRVLFTFDSETAASKSRPDIQVKSQKDSKKLPLVINSSNKKELQIATNNQMADLEILNDPYKDNLGLEFKTELTTEEGRKKIQDAINTIYNGVDSAEKKEYQEQLNYLTKQYEYVTKHNATVKNSVQTLSQLGSPGEEGNRTQQSFNFDNLDITGFYLKPGQVNKINVYVDSKDPSKVVLARRQAGITENNSYTSLSTYTNSLKNGWNEITIDLTNNQHGQMVYFRNNSTDNETKVRIEGQDANTTNTVEGTNLGRHAYFIYDGKNADQFKDYVDEVNKQVEAVNSTSTKSAVKDQVQDMTIIQTGETQLAMRATLAKKIMEDEKITSVEDASRYVKTLNAAMDERLTYFWKYAGFAPTETGVNKTSDMRLYVAFTKNVTSPSSMYAIGGYYHMPEDTARAFMNGTALYGWGMSHEYGHMLDNRSLVVAEETNNMYSLWGSREKALKTFNETGEDTFDIDAKNTAYHPQMKDQYKNMNKYLADRIKNPNLKEGGFSTANGFFKVGTWFLGTHYFDDWDYSNYDYDNSPYTKELAEDVKTYGAYGTALRIMRSEQGREIDKNISTKYHRMIIAFTMATGYNFAEYMDSVGETDIPQNVKDFCAKYPSMPRKVQYYSLNADGKQAMGYKEYSGKVEPTVTVTEEDNSYKVKATLPEEQAKSTIAYELYQDGKLVDFSRTGEFTVDKTAKETPEFSVRTYDFRLNQSRKSGAKTSLEVKDVTITEGDSWNDKQAFVSATDEDGKSVDFDKVTVSGSVDPNKSGQYTLTFSYDGEEKTATITVKEQEKKPVYHKDNRYASVIKDNYTLWSDLDFKQKKGSTKAIYHKTVKVKGYYTHPNGSTYASLYDKDDKWLGYVNSGAVEYQKNAGGKYYSVNKYAAIVKNNYTLWNDLDFKKKKGNTKSLYKKTVYVKGEYHHFNGSTYVTIYDKDNKWLGYLNVSGLEYQKNAGGKYYSVNKKATVLKNNYTLWNDLDFKKKKGNTKSLYKKTVYVKGEYHHFNGSIYASVYDKQNGKWLGYLNMTGLKLK